MAVAAEILRSQDCLRQHNPHRDNKGNAVFNHKNHGNVTNSMRSRRKKWSPTSLARRGRDESRDKVVLVDKKKDSGGFSAKNFVMGQVKILKRGEPLPEMNKKMVRETKTDDGNHEEEEEEKEEEEEEEEEEMILCSSGRLGPDPDLVQKQIRASDFYAGSAPIVASPHPSSLPFPGLLAKHEKKSQPATMDLLQMLKLD